MSKNTRSKNISKLLILALVLFVPGFLYILVNKVGSNHYVKLPIYGEKIATGKVTKVMGREIPDTIYHKAAAIDLKNYNGETVKFLGSDTTLSIVHLFYSRDSSLSKQLLENFSTIADKFQLVSKIKLYSMSVDTSDSAEDIIKVREPYSKIKNPNWFFTLAPNAAFLDYLRNNLLIEAMVSPTDSSRYVISRNFVLLDSQGRIRGMYDVSVKKETSRLEDEIKVLHVEEARKKSLKVEKQ